MTPSQKVNADLTALLRARHTCIWIVTREELRVERAIVEAAAGAKLETKFWDCATGLTDAAGKTIAGQMQNPSAVLARIKDDSQRGLYVLRDLHKWFDPVVLREVRSLVKSLQSSPRTSARAIVILTPSSEVPPELAGHATVIDYPLPARQEIGEILDAVLGGVSEELAEAAKLTNGARDSAIDAAVGLTAEEAANCYAKSLVTTRRIDVVQIASEKRRVIAREKVLKWYDPDPRGLDAVGGLEYLKDWLRIRRQAFSQKARDFGIPDPRGLFLAGVSGCGKSLTAKAVAAAWGMPLLQLDMGALRSKYVGESEGNIRKALQVAEAVSPCILWLDEIEKALAGATGPQGDGGVSADALGAVLSWMQERAGAVFVIATANDVSGLPPELLRKGRFDELFFVDLPTLPERVEVLRVTLEKLCPGKYEVELEKVAYAAKGFTGSEVAAIVPDAMFTAFADGERKVTTADLFAAAKTVAPLAETAKEKVEGLRKWANGRARAASPELVEADRQGRDLDI